MWFVGEFGIICYEIKFVFVSGVEEDKGKFLVGGGGVVDLVVV